MGNIGGQMSALITNQEYNLLSTIVQVNNFGRIITCEKINSGFNRITFCINKSYLIKICIDISRETGTIKEIDYYSCNKDSFHPQLISFDKTKETIPYIYSVEQYIEGDNLFDVWDLISRNQREKVLFKLLEIIRKIHFESNKETGIPCNIEKEFDSYLKEIISLNILSQDKIEHLLHVQSILNKYFSNYKYGFIHGDLHFNNIIINDQNLILIDFERYGLSPIDREFDSLNRMCRNPLGFTKELKHGSIKAENYIEILSFFRKNYSEICGSENFEDRILVYDCINALEWLRIYPNNKTYCDVLFNKSKRLIR